MSAHVGKIGDDRVDTRFLMFLVIFGLWNSSVMSLCSLSRKVGPYCSFVLGFDSGASLL